MQPPEPTQTVEKTAGTPVYRVDDLVVDTGRVTVTRDGQELALPRLSFDLLVALIATAPRVVSQDELMTRVWPGLVVSPETVSQRVKLLRDSLGDDPKTPRYIAGVRGRGYRLLAPVARIRDAVSGEVIEDPAAPASLQQRWALALAALALVAVGGIAWYLTARPRETAAPMPTAAELPARSVAVLAFENRGGAAGTEILAEGIPETVLYQLSRMPGLTVIARGSSFAFRGGRDDLRVIGRQLNVRYLLEGSVQTAGERLRVTSSLVDAASGASVWSMQFDRGPRDVFAVQDEIALEVARAMQITLDAASGTAALPNHGGTADYDAYVAFLRGRALIANQRVADLPAAIDALTAAVQQDTNFAAAHVLLARAKIASAELSPAPQFTTELARAKREAAQLLDRAIELDPKSGEAYVERGYLKAYLDLAGADADLRHGIELSPNYARGYEVLAAVQFQSLARRRSALELIEKARRLDPLEPRLDVLKATYLNFGPGDCAQAIRILRTVLERDPLYVPALVRLSTLLWNYKGAHAESIQFAEQAVAIDPDNEFAWQQLGAGYLEVDDYAAAADAFSHMSNDPTHGRLSLLLYRKDWLKAGEAAYAMVAAGSATPYDERQIALGIRLHARRTGQYDRAIATLVDLGAVYQEDDEWIIQNQLDLGVAVAGLGDMLMQKGRRAEARQLLETLLADLDVRENQYGRGSMWTYSARALAQALLGRPDDAMATLKHHQESGTLSRERNFELDYDPAYDSMRSRADFQALIRSLQAVQVRERAKLERMRTDGLVPARPAERKSAP